MASLRACCSAVAQGRGPGSRGCRAAVVVSLALPVVLLVPVVVAMAPARGRLRVNLWPLWVLRLLVLSVIALQVQVAAGQVTPPQLISLVELYVATNGQHWVSSQGSSVNRVPINVDGGGAVNVTGGGRQRGRLGTH